MHRLALRYASTLRLCVLPLLVRGKQPHGLSVPRGYLDATRDPSVIGAWWRRAPRANVGIACAPSYLVVLDIDPRNGGDETLAALEGALGPLPPTWTALTPGGGQHYYFHWLGNVDLASLGEGIDVKNKGYVVAPPSIHPNGGVYRWDIATLPSMTPLASLPDAWQRRLLRGREVPSGPDERRVPASTGVDARLSFLGVAFDALGWLGPAAPEGRRWARCPWAEQHTDGRGFGRDSSTVLFSPLVGTELGAFHCSHGHCAGRSAVDVIATIREHAPETIDAAARAYPATYRRVLTQLARTEGTERGL